MICILIIFNLIGLENLSDFYNYYELLKNKLVENTVVKMKFVMYHNGVFYMRDKAFGKSFIQLSDMIQEFSAMYLHPYLPHQNDELCLGLFPGIC